MWVELSVGSRHKGFSLGPPETANKCRGSVVAELLKAPNSNSGVCDQQSVGSNPQP